MDRHIHTYTHRLTHTRHTYTDEQISTTYFQGESCDSEREDYSELFSPRMSKDCLYDVDWMQEVGKGKFSIVRSFGHCYICKEQQ